MWQRIKKGKAIAETCGVKSEIGNLRNNLQKQKAPSQSQFPKNKSSTEREKVENKSLWHSNKFGDRKCFVSKQQTLNFGT